MLNFRSAQQAVAQAFDQHTFGISGYPKGFALQQTFLNRAVYVVDNKADELSFAGLPMEMRLKIVGHTVKTARGWMIASRELDSPDLEIVSECFLNTLGLERNEEIPARHQVLNHIGKTFFEKLTFEEKVKAYSRLYRNHVPKSLILEIHMAKVLNYGRERMWMKWTATCLGAFIALRILYKEFIFFQSYTIKLAKRHLYWVQSWNYWAGHAWGMSPLFRVTNVYLTIARKFPRQATYIVLPYSMFLVHFFACLFLDELDADYLPTGLPGNQATLNERLLWITHLLSFFAVAPFALSIHMFQPLRAPATDPDTVKNHILSCFPANADEKVASDWNSLIPQETTPPIAASSSI